MPPLPSPPLSIAFAWQQWGLHLAAAPARQLALWQLGVQQWTAMATAAAVPGCTIQPVHDRRLAGPAWQRWPFCLIAGAFTLQQTWWQEATRDVPGLSARAAHLVGLSVHQMLQAMSPANIAVIHPDVLAATAREGGANLLRGAIHLADDLRRLREGLPPAGAEVHAVGLTVATAPGRVVFRNRLIELIQYAPATDKVFAEPVLMVPAWIMKYYVLDLSPHNSMVKFLVQRGHTVFMVSWLNPDTRDRELSLDDYRTLGIEQALRAIAAIRPGQPVHGVGYCLGGTLLAIAAAVQTRDAAAEARHGGRAPSAAAATVKATARSAPTACFASITLLGALTDFEQPGELGVFIDEAQLRWLERAMSMPGYLDSRQMAAAFALLRPGEVLWEPATRAYLLGERAAMTDLAAWSSDGTRMPARMHAEYLRALYQRNDLAHGRLLAGGRPVSLADLRLPVFLLATASDPVAPWASVCQLHRLTATEITFVLTTGGHNYGVVNPPDRVEAGAPAGVGTAVHRSYQIALRTAGDTGAASGDRVAAQPQEWAARSPKRPGSWWPAWQSWLAARSSQQLAPPPLGSDGLDYGRAPGAYVTIR